MQITLCLYPRFSNFCLANALEPLRAANDLSEEAHYRWQIVTPDGAPVTSSSGIEIAPEAALCDARGAALFVISSYGYEALTGRGPARSLRAAAARHDICAGLDTGAWLMAEAGLLKGRAATVHWDEFAAFEARFTDIEAKAERVVRDGPRWTCGGATTAFDLVLGLIEAQHGASLRLEVAALFMHGEWRGSLPAKPSGEARVDAALALMRRHVSQPLPIAEVARQVGMSVRRMEALFAEKLSASPRQTYRHLRLGEAKRLLRQTSLSITDIAARCGYEDPSAMSRAFRCVFGETPSAQRRRVRMSVPSR